MNIINRLSSNIQIVTVFLVFNLVVLFNIIPLAGNFIIFITLLTLPGALMMSWLRTKWAVSRLETLLFTVGLSLAYLIIVGLLINAIGPILHITQPLGKIPILIMWDVLLILPACLIKHQNKLNFISLLKLPKLSLIDAIFFVTPLILLILTIAGVQVLNNNGPEIVAVISLIGFSIYISTAVLWRKKLSSYIYPWAIFIMGLALLLSYSLRSSYLMGWDIHQEYYVFQLTNIPQHWVIGSYREPYNACLSITVLPTMFSSLLKISDIYIFKVIFQIIFAFTPLVIYALSRYVIPAKKNYVRFLAAALFVSQFSFITQMPALIRQEIGFLFFGLVLLAIFAKPAYSRILTIIFAIAMILSHYSTAYIGLSLFIMYTLIRYALPRYKPRLISLRVLVLLLIITFLWQGQLTNTSNGAAQTFKDTFTTLPQIFTKNGLDSTIQQLTFSNPSVNTDENVSKNYANISKESAATGMNSYPLQTYQDYQPYALPPNGSQPKVNAHVANLLLKFVTLLKFIVIILLPLVGIAYIGIYLSRKKVSNSISESFILTMGGLILIALITLLPFLKDDYNFTRLYQQILFLLAPITVFGGLIVFRKFDRAKPIAVACLVSLFLLYSSGVYFYFLGGAAFPTLTNKSDDYQLYRTQKGEVLSAQWLSAHKGDGLIHADRVTALELMAYGNLQHQVQTNVYPSTLGKNVYVYAGQNNLNGKNYQIYSGGLLRFSYPNQFLNNQKNIIYSSGSSVIYK